MICNPFQADAVHLGSEEWTEEVALQAKDITQWGGRELSLCNNHRATVVKQITHIHFTGLTNLLLAGNRIESVEGLPRVQMAHISFLSLDNNNITSVGVMRKAAWPGLRTLMMDNNYTRDSQNLMEGCFPELQALAVYDPWMDDKNACTKQCFPAKMQASPTFLHIKGNKFCFDRSLKSVLQRRWPHSKIK